MKKLQVFNYAFSRAAQRKNKSPFVDFVKNHKLKQEASNQERKSQKVQESSRKHRENFEWKRETIIAKFCELQRLTNLHTLILAVIDQKGEQKRGKNSNKL